VLLVLIAVVAFVLHGRRQKGDVILLTGAMDVGKTTLVQYLRHGALPTYGTVPSMKLVEHRFVPSPKVVQLNASDTSRLQGRRWIEVPGHPALRADIEKYASATVAQIIMLDAANPGTITAAAALLFDAVYVRDFLDSSRRVPILVACNKSDVADSASIKSILNAMEKDVEKCRVAALSASSTSSAADFSLSERSDDKAILAERRRRQKRLEQTFSFDGLGRTIQTASISVVKADLGPILNFLRLA